MESEVKRGDKAAEIWAIALSEDGQFLAGTSYEGKINVWNLGDGSHVREYETKGSFGTCVDLSRDGKFTASGHKNGGVYVFNNDTGRMLFSLPGKLIGIPLSLVSQYYSASCFSNNSQARTWLSMQNRSQDILTHLPQV